MERPFLPHPFPPIPTQELTQMGWGGGKWTQGVGELESHLVEKVGQS